MIHSDVLPLISGTVNCVYFLFLVFRKKGLSVLLNLQRASWFSIKTLFFCFLFSDDRTILVPHDLYGTYPLCSFWVCICALPLHFPVDSMLFWDNNCYSFLSFPQSWVKLDSAVVDNPILEVGISWFILLFIVSCRI